ncbi:MAG: SpoIIIAH-like family protein [Clostridia bacterium]|nr:SpoIIIAH-like family protein [Clostridia bacterium]
MQLLGKNYFENENVLPENGAEESRVSPSEESAPDGYTEEGLEALCEAVGGEGKHRIPAWMAAAANTVRENRRHLAAAASVLVIGFAVYLNWAMYEGDDAAVNTGADAVSGAVLSDTGDSDAAADAVSAGDTAVDGTAGGGGESDDYFAVSQINRQRARDEAIAVLQDVVDGAENLSEVQNEALAEIAQIAEDIEHEAAIESLVKGKGFTECVAVISGENANVIVKSTALLPNEVAQIQEIVYETAGIVPANVKIIEK